ncbi:MAG: hypothetical protein ACRDRZ_13200, partial [Pseudonocardiaceae bacterium]
RAVDELAGLPAGVDRDAALCRARSAGVGALLVLDALDAAQQWMDGVHAEHPGQRVRVACQRAVLLRRRGRPDEAIAVLRAAERLADANGMAALAVATQVELAELLADSGDLDGAADRLARVLEALPAVPDPDPLDAPNTRMELARVQARAGRLGEAATELRRARTEAVALPEGGDMVATLDYWLGGVLRGLGLPVAAMERFEAAAAGFAAVGRPDGVASAERDRGTVLFGLRRDAEAAAAFDAAASARRTDGDEWHALACDVDAAQARGYAGLGDAGAELRGLRARLPWAAAVRAAPPEDAELLFETARVDHALARCALATGDADAAAELAEQALTGYRAAGADRAVAALSLDAGRWRWHAGDAGSARRYLHGALRASLGLGDRVLVTRCEELLESLDGAQPAGDDPYREPGDDITLPEQR